MKNNHLNNPYLPTSYPLNNSPQFPHPLQSLDAQIFSPDLLLPQRIRQKVPNDINHIHYEIIDKMYDLLTFSGDLNFATVAGEMIYNIARVDDQDFVNWAASYYWSNRRNMIYHEMIENIFTTYSSILNMTGNLNVISGEVKKVGLKGRQEVVLFVPSPTQQQTSCISQLIFRNRYF
jgi:hypothetical protein